MHRYALDPTRIWQVPPFWHGALSHAMPYGAGSGHVIGTGTGTGATVGAGATTHDGSVLPQHVKDELSSPQAMSYIWLASELTRPQSTGPV